MKNKNYIFLILCAFSSFASFSQNLLFPQEYIWDQYKNASAYTLLSKDTLQNTSLFPNRIVSPIDFDKSNFYKENRKWLVRKLFQDSWISINKSDTLAGEVNQFRFSLDPLFNFQYGKTNETESYCYTNTRGIIARLGINNNFYFETAFSENQSTFLSYVDDAVQSSKEVVGQGRWKKFKDGTGYASGYDYAMASGVVWWKPAKWFEIYAGHGKQKIGNGYRSLLLSDQSFNYPYARFDFNITKAHLKYTTTYALLMNTKATANANPTQFTPPGTEVLLQKKPFSFQYLSWTPEKHFSIGLFQGIVWQPTDAQNKADVHLDFVNPVIGINTAVHGFNSYPKILLGADATVKILKDLHLYGQFAFDGEKVNNESKKGYGIQGGVKWFNAFTLKNLFMQGELNMYRNRLYSINSVSSVTGYTHYGNQLTLPAYGDNGNELVGIAAYRFKRIMFSGKGNFMFYNYYLNKDLQRKYITSIDAKLSVIINPKSNMNISVGSMSRNFNSLTLKQIFKKGTVDQMFYISFKTSLYNIYFDF